MWSSKTDWFISSIEEENNTVNGLSVFLTKKNPLLWEKKMTSRLCWFSHFLTSNNIIALSYRDSKEGSFCLAKRKSSYQVYLLFIWINLYNVMNRIYYIIPCNEQGYKLHHLQSQEICVIRFSFFLLFIFLLRFLSCWEIFHHLM